MLSKIDTFFSDLVSSTPFHRLHLKESSIQLLHVGQGLNDYFDVNDARVNNSFDSYSVSLFYCYSNGFYSSKISGLIPVNHEFLCNTYRNTLEMCHS